MAVILLGTALRLYLIASGWPHLNSDEGIMGLMALHISGRGELPIFFYGQSYMGALEAYLGAIFFLLLGPSSFALRLGPVLLFGLFLVVLYVLAGRLYGKRVALVSLVILSLGPERMLFRQLQAIGGYMETLLFGTLALLLALFLVSSPPDPSAPARGGWRAAAFAALGLAVGLGLWSDVLILPWVVGAGALLVAWRRGELRSRLGLALLAGAVLGASPLLGYDLQTIDAGKPLDVLLAGYRAGQSGGRLDLGKGLAATVLVSLPVITGGMAVCAVADRDAWPLSARSSPHTVGCTAAHGVWGGAMMLLWTFAVIRALLGLLKRRSPADGVHLAILLAAGLTVALYVLSPASALSPWFNARYLTSVWIALPSLLAPLMGPARGPEAGRLRDPSRLWTSMTACSRILHGCDTSRLVRVVGGRAWGAVEPGSRASVKDATTEDPHRRLQWPPFKGRPRGQESFEEARAARLGMVVSYAVVGVALACPAVGTVEAVQSIPYVQWVNSNQMALVDQLTAMRGTRIYSDYWTCGRIIFQSDERIICAALDGRLRPGLDRYPPYRAIVRHAARPRYVFPAGSPQAAAFARDEARVARYQAIDAAAGYVIYRPLAR
ncbi:MAG: glycosyltransferase family 39 protein [Chloroflexi bacterium]|nr:glycosyltransferase family 39 protein [Chloroflexota bacterium]